MVFNSFGFILIFLPLTVLGFAVCRRQGAGLAIGWLLACSVGFAALSQWTAAVFLVASMLINAGLGWAIRKTEAVPLSQSLVMTAAIGLNLMALGVLRTLPEVPLGLSFITFTQIGFLLDQRTADPRAATWAVHGLLVGFFPHLAAGPILRIRDVIDQFADPATWRLTSYNVAVGSGYVLIGLLKKTLLADPLAPVVAAGFAEPGGLTLLAAWQVALAWSFQLYFDFSGYSDMAVGLARLFGVRFPANFASPYKAQSIIEYWQRWHMSLTRFLMSTVHTPLTLAVLRSRRARGWRIDRAAQCTLAGFSAMVLAPIGVTMGLVGLWHGSNPTFLAFGALHAALLGVNHAWRLLLPAPRSQRAAAVLGRVTLTYLCVLVGAVVFRAPSLSVAGSVLVAMLGGHGWSGVSPDLALLRDAAWLAALGVIIWAMPNSQQIMEADSGWLRWQPTPRWAAAAGCAASLGLISLGGAHEFVYFQF